ncbi:cyclin-J isoform X2 [Bacillus rossius redtenbacheri]
MSSVNSWWYTEYAEDIHAALRQKELKRAHFHYQSPQLQDRIGLVRWLSSKAEKLSLSLTTVHLAVYLLDVFMDNHSITAERLKLVVLVCVLLAAKFEEQEVNVPTARALNTMVGGQYVIKDYTLLEIMVLRHLQWNLLLPTAAQFAQYYTREMTSAGDLRHAPHFASYRELECHAYDCIKDYLDETLLDISVHQFLPSVVASTCVLATRRHLDLTPEWTPTLGSLTGYEYRDLQPCLSWLLSLRQKQKLASPDHGYVTEEGSPEVMKMKGMLSSKANH